ncbi:hypothetical protein [Couchioplanes caeruleus]|uniref:Uncharacterized protein n=2 Tax=Couchioplanes caeruleus TaxID=56438 RepID=A0A1K0FPA1_9ACTN|nr:hypothetical protein [Couchioplanes caeruleus]OJF14536.1 hypothetical protein BG844_09395 [Couchioplanes caeruleus subsp. caeruleus]ROP21304.1 hypothetical protein EDD30_7705 [Couchioplanes caeruleus]
MTVLPQALVEAESTVVVITVGPCHEISKCAVLAFGDSHGGQHEVGPHPVALLGIARKDAPQHIYELTNRQSAELLGKTVAILVGAHKSDRTAEIIRLERLSTDGVDVGQALPADGTPVRLLATVAAPRRR